MNPGLIMYKELMIAMCFVKCIATEMEGHISQGQYADIKQYPHHVLLEIISRRPLTCGGSIINQVTVLTAAHCFEEIDKLDKMYARYGSVHLSDLRSTPVKKYVLHRDYDTASMYADVALVSCKHTIKLGNYAKKVVLTRQPPKQKNAYVLGWGAINGYVSMSETLMQVKQEIRSSNLCHSKLDTPIGTFCAGPVNGPGSPAEGDSGGALVIRNYIQIGIVSYAVREYALVAYTNVSHFYRWINTHARHLYCYENK